MSATWRVARASLVTAAIAILAVPAPAGAAKPEPKDPGPELRYTIREARAYVYRVTLRREVIEGARRADPCDPAEDPYQCDTTRYEHEPNCPPSLAVGPQGALPEVRPVPGARPLEGGAGAHEGPEAEPPTASPITINELLGLAHFGHIGRVVEAGGLASDSYVDLSGRQEPTLHTESDVIPGLPRYEERCLADNPQSYRHFLSRTGETPETYHLAECRKDRCTFDRLLFSTSDVMGRTIVHMKEEGGKIVGRMQATFNDASWGNGAFAFDTVDTILTFESDGTAEGLRWSVGTTAKGTRLGGQPVTLPTGRLVGTADLQAGIAAPYVSAAENGSSLRVVAPGVIVASREQTAWFGGAEVEATFGDAAEAATAGDLLDEAGSDATTDEGGAGGAAGGAAGSSGGVPGSDAGGSVGAGGAAGAGASTDESSIDDAAQTAGSAEAVSARRFETALAFFLVLLGGFLGALWIVSRWMGGYRLGRALSYYPPFSTIERIYRTFVKS